MDCPAKELTIIPFDPNGPIVKRQAGKASKGVYISYTDMLRNTPSEDGDVLMLLDGNSGQPFFLSNSEVKTLLEQYPDLLQEYKKSKRENADVKDILIKYYALQQ